MLKRISQTDLQLTLAVFGYHLAEVATLRIRSQATARYAAPIGMVQPVKCFKAKSEELAFCCMERLEQAGTPVLETRLIEDVPAPLIGESTGRRCKDIHAGLECIPLAHITELPGLWNIAVDEVTRAEPVVAVSRITASRADTGDVLSGLDGDGGTRLELSDLRNLPATEKFTREFLLVFESWDLIDEVDNRHVPVIEVRESVLDAPILIRVRQHVALTRSVVHALGVSVSESGQEAMSKPAIHTHLQRVINGAGIIVGLPDRSESFERTKRIRIDGRIGKRRAR